MQSALCCSRVRIQLSWTPKEKGTVIFTHLMKSCSLNRSLSRKVVVAVMTLWGCGRMPEALSQVNSWTNPASGYWEDQRWSLGTLPGPGQSILLTNAGWKALGITANTAQNYPQTLNVDSITISSPTNSFNTLLLNYAGFVTPLTANSLTVASNSAVVMDSSALQVARNLSVGGTFTEDNFSRVTTAWNLDVGYNGPGIFNLNSGILAAGSVSVGSSFPSQFVQQGGTNTAGNLKVYADSEYDLNDGELATWIYVRAGGTFNLRGGNYLATSTGSHIDGRFFQSGGTIDGALMFPPDEGPWGTPHQINAIGTGLQTGGTNHAIPLQVGFFRMPSVAPYTPLPSGGGSYTLSNGVLVTSETVIAPSGGMQQWGGTHEVNGTLSVRGSIEYYHGVANRVYSAGYGLGAGILLPRAISIGVAAGLTQSGGTNQVSEAITLSGSTVLEPAGDRYPGTYQLAGGLLTASNLILNARSEFFQTDGQLMVSNIQLNGGSFFHSGGQLVVSNIQIMGGVFSHSGGAMTHSGVLTLAGGSWSVPGGQTQQFGRLEVLGASTLDIGSSGSGDTTVLRFQDSRDVPWTGATFAIVHWNSSTGPGPDHVFVGTNAQGLTADQLDRVIFVRPDGSPGNFSAAILPTGELVPGVVHDYNYTTTNGAITITGYTGAGGDVTIPSTINNLPVTTIGAGAFRFCSSLTNVTIPSSVINIGEQAFAYCNGLTNFVIGSSVTSIGSDAFYSCNSLKSIMVGNSVTSVGDWAFRYCSSLNTVTIGNSVTNIGSYAFADCTSLTSITIPDSVTNIGEGAFSSCTRLTYAAFGNGGTSIGSSAFSFCTSLTNVTLGNSITIGGWAFCGCRSLTSVTIPNSVTSLGEFAFQGCISLTGVAIGNSVTAIGNNAFYGCTNLTALAVDPLNSSYSSVDGVLFNRSQTTLIECLESKAGSYTVPESVTAIGDMAFTHCNSLTSVTVGNSVTSIGEGAFSSCVGLTSATMGNSVTSIGNGAFSSCTSLTYATLGNSVTSLGDYAFANCPSLTAVYFRGAAPGPGSSLFFYATPTVHYLPGTMGWGPTFAERPTAPWGLPNPVILDFGPSFGLQTNGFGFIISWATNVPVVVEACTDLVNGVWLPVSTNALPDGWAYFSDPQWANYPSRFYRVRSP